MFVPYNPNPLLKNTTDCTIRAITKIFNMDWDTAYLWLTLYGFIEKTYGDVNATWGAFLKSRGFVREIIPNTCPDCYTIADFCIDNPRGQFVVATGSHVVAVVDGDYYDTWDSGSEVPVYYWRKENSK